MLKGVKEKKRDGKVKTDMRLVRRSDKRLGGGFLRLWNGAVKELVSAVDVLVRTLQPRSYR